MAIGMYIKTDKRMTAVKCDFETFIWEGKPCDWNFSFLILTAEAKPYHFRTWLCSWWVKENSCIGSRL